MSIEILLLAVLAGITLLAYMVAINSHGPTRLSISYLLATLILAGTVWATVQYVNEGLDRQKAAQMRKLEMENQRAEERIRSQEKTLLESRKRTAYAAKLNAVISQGTGLATSLINANLRDMSVDLDALIGRATMANKKSEELQEQFNKARKEVGQGYYMQSIKDIATALDELDEASRYYRLYYYSEDGAQEQLRERLMRQKAREAYEALKEASAQMAAES
jgi:hypothetical protein